jgi:hypothetical protein
MLIASAASPAEQDAIKAIKRVTKLTIGLFMENVPCPATVKELGGSIEN